MEPGGVQDRLRAVYEAKLAEHDQLRLKERKLSSQAGQLLKALKAQESLTRRLSLCINKVRSDRKSLLKKIKTPRWEISHHYHMTAIEHCMGHSQPHVLEVGVMCGHLRLFALAKRGVLIQKALVYASNRATAIRNDASDKITPIYAQLTEARAQVKATNGILEAMRNKQKLWDGGAKDGKPGGAGGGRAGAPMMHHRMSVRQRYFSNLNLSSSRKMRPMGARSAASASRTSVSGGTGSDGTVGSGKQLHPSQSTPGGLDSMKEAGAEQQGQGGDGMELNDVLIMLDALEKMKALEKTARDTARAEKQAKIALEGVRVETAPGIASLPTPLMLGEADDEFDHPDVVNSPSSLPADASEQPAVPSLELSAGVGSSSSKNRQSPGAVAIQGSSAAGAGTTVHADSGRPALGRKVVDVRGNVSPVPSATVGGVGAGAKQASAAGVAPQGRGSGDASEVAMEGGVATSGKMPSSLRDSEATAASAGDKMTATPAAAIIVTDERTIGQPREEKGGDDLEDEDAGKPKLIIQDQEALVDAAAAWELEERPEYLRHHTLVLKEREPFSLEDTAAVGDSNSAAPSPRHLRVSVDASEGSEDEAPASPRSPARSPRSPRSQSQSPRERKPHSRRKSSTSWLSYLLGNRDADL